jgi:hypothetical protein
VEYAANRVSYREISGIRATFGWDEDLMVNGRKIALDGYPRYDTPFVKTARGKQVYRIQHGAQMHVIDLAGLRVGPFRDMA